MGANHSVHMANASGQNISVFVGLNPTWSLLDFFLDITLITIGSNEIRGLALAAADFNYHVPGKLETLRDLFEYAVIARVMLTGPRSVDSRMLSAAQRFVDAIRKTAISIPHGKFENIHERNVLQIYLNPSGYAGILGAQTVTVFVMSADGKQVALYNTGPDHSWIATAEQTIVRARYGTIWQQDPGAGNHAWLIGGHSGGHGGGGLPGDTAVPLPLPLPREYAMDDVDGKVDVTDGAAGGVDGKVDAVDDLADVVDGKVG